MILTSFSNQAATPVAGVALVNGTPTVISWTAPNDGQQHRAQVILSLSVTVNATGGQLAITWTAPDGSTVTSQLLAPSQSAGLFREGTPAPVICKAGTVVSVTQSTALTVGAATLWAEIWGS